MDTKTKPSILIVDDDKLVLKSFKMMLSREGFNVFTTFNGEEAMQYILENMIDVAVVDFRISKEDGLSVAQKLKNADQYLKIIMLTGFPSYETAVQSMKIGVFDYLSKNSSGEQIIEVLNKAVSERQAERAILEQNTSKDKRPKTVLFCNHSLIKERLETRSKKSQVFRLVKTFPTLDTLTEREASPDIEIALICAECNTAAFANPQAMIAQLSHIYPGSRILIINENFPDPQKVELLNFGIKGFCPDESGCEILEKAITDIAKGAFWVTAEVSKLFRDTSPSSSLPPLIPSPPKPSKNSETSSHSKYAPDEPGLTAKEKEILKRISDGAKNKEIADQLTISEATVKTHINRILKKLGVNTRTKAILAVVERKIFKSE
ncbi:MAG: response regulator [Candidatus Omnitrophota bacterium]